MTVQISKSSEYMNKLHDTLGTFLGGTAINYRVEGIENYIEVTALNGVTNGELTNYLNKWNSLILSSNKANNEIIANGTDEIIITCSPYTNFDCFIWLENVVVTSLLSIIDGAINFSTDTPGSYVVELRLVDGTNGYINVTAIEVA